MRRLLAFAVLVAILMQGCFVYSVNPFYNQEDLVTDEALDGNWHNKASKKDRWCFKQQDTVSYVITRDQDGEKTEYKASLFRIDGEELLDVYPEDNCRGFAVMPVHLALRFERKKDIITLTPLDYRAVGEELRNKRFEVEHIFVEEDVVLLTDATPKLRQFLRECLRQGRMWHVEEEIKLRRLE